MNMSQEALVLAYKKGYRITEDGRVTGLRKPFLKPQTHPMGYLYFMVTMPNTVFPVFLHRLAAYQKFGNKLFEPGIETRHLNGDMLDNRPNNISIGTPTQNALDKRRYNGSS